MSMSSILKPPPQIKQIVVRPARPEDEKRILLLSDLFFYDKPALVCVFHQPNIDVADTEQGVCGFALTVIRGPRVYIERIAVFEDCREQGIGSALIEGIVARAQQQGRKRVICFSSEYAPASTHSFLANRGFWSRIHPVPQRLRRPVDTPEGETRRGVYVFTRELPSEGEA